MEVKFAQPERMNLIGYFLRDMFLAKLATAEAEAAAQSLRGAILFSVHGMEVTLVFGDGALEIHHGRLARLHAEIEGDLTALLDVALGTSYLRALFKRQIRVRGNLLKLLKLMKLLRVTNP